MNPYRIIGWTFLLAVGLALLAAGLRRFGVWNMIAFWGLWDILRRLGSGLYNLLEIMETPSTRRFY